MPLAPKETKWRQAWDRARNVIEHQGPSGKALGQSLQEMRDLAETTAGDWVSRLPVTRKLGKVDFLNFWDVVEGNAQPRNTMVQHAVGEWTQIRPEIRALAQDAGLDVGFIADYMPHVFDPKVFQGQSNWNKAIDHLVKTGQATTNEEASKILYYAREVARNRRYGNLELSRDVNLPGYEKTKEALFGYVESAAKRIAHVKVLGLEDSKAIALIQKIANEGGDASAAMNEFNIASGAQKYGRYQAATSATLRGFNVLGKLGLGAISNATQPLNIATVVGGLRTILLSPKAAFSPEAHEFALKTGVILDGVISQIREGSGFSGKMMGIGAPGFNTVERFNRTLAAVVGRSFADDMARDAVKGSREAIRALTTMGLDVNTVVARGGKLTLEEQIRAARNIVERTQFKVDPQDLPGWASGPWPKVLTQFRTFSYNQTAFMAREIIQPALRGNTRPLLTFLIFGLPAGAAAMELQHLLRNRPSEEDRVQWLRQVYQRVGGLGLLGDVLAGLAPPNSKYLSAERYALQASSVLLGPTASTVQEGIGTLASFTQGKPEGLQRFLLKQIPVIGQTIKNTVLPYKPGGRSGDLTPLEKRLQGSGSLGGSGLSPLEKRLQQQVGVQ